MEIIIIKNELYRSINPCGKYILKIYIKTIKENECFLIPAKDLGNADIKMRFLYIKLSK